MPGASTTLGPPPILFHCLIDLHRARTARYDTFQFVAPLRVESVLRQQRVGMYVFTGPRGGRMKEAWCLHCLKKDQAKLGLALGDLHGFSRFFATTMMQAGVSAETVRQWGEWKSLETMLRYLADVDVKDSVAAMQQAVKRQTAS